MNAADIARLLAQKIDGLARDLLPNGHKEGAEWRCGWVAGEPGNSLGVHLPGAKAGIWCDFTTKESGDALDLIAAVNGTDLKDAWIWAHQWLGLQIDAPAARSQQPSSPRLQQPTAQKQKQNEDDNPERWQRPWHSAKPIAGTLAQIYLRARGLDFEDPDGEVLRFTPKHWRRNENDQPEHHPALLGLLRDTHTGEACGIHNIYLLPSGVDRLRDRKAKTTWGRKAGAAVMLDPFYSPLYGLVIVEGIETSLSVLIAQLHPVWAVCGAGSVAVFPVLGGIETLTIAADNDGPGQKAAATCAARWLEAEREVLIITPPGAKDWAEARRAAP
jgi:hypothetical protein